MPTQLIVSRTLSVPADRIFALIASPARHTELDDSGMLRGLAEGPERITAVGDVFTLDMYQDLVGHEYRMANHVVAFEPDRVLAWSPHRVGRGPLGHTYRYDLDPLDDGRTQVTQTYDWSEVTDPQVLPHFPRVSREQLDATLQKIESVLAEQA